jgi:hypothetical protein
LKTVILSNFLFAFYRAANRLLEIAWHEFTGAHVYNSDFIGYGPSASLARWLVGVFWLPIFHSMKPLISSLDSDSGRGGTAFPVSLRGVARGILDNILFFAVS